MTNFCLWYTTVIYAVAAAATGLIGACNVIAGIAYTNWEQALAGGVSLLVVPVLYALAQVFYNNLSNYGD